MQQTSAHQNPVHQISAAGLTARISDLGAELQSLDLPDGRALLWHGDPAFWCGRSPVLFPIVGRARDDRLTLEGQPIEMAQHGFARRSPFALIAKGPDFTHHRLTDSPESRARYPRAFQLDLHHSLGAQGLSIRAEVTNTDNRPLPFGLGFHPAFVWPLPGATGKAHEIRLANGAAPLRRLLEGGLIGERLLPSPFRQGRLELSLELFAEDALIFPEGAGDRLIYGPAEGPHLAFRFENLPNLALWTKPGAPFLCIEPWQGMAARAKDGPALEDRPGTLTLAPGESRHFALHVTPVGL